MNDNYSGNRTARLLLISLLEDNLMADEGGSCPLLEEVGQEYGVTLEPLRKVYRALEGHWLYPHAIIQAPTGLLPEEEQGSDMAKTDIRMFLVLTISCQGPVERDLKLEGYLSAVMRLLNEYEFDGGIVRVAEFDTSPPSAGKTDTIQSIGFSVIVSMAE
jgi:hypothetical protein